MKKVAENVMRADTRNAKLNMKYQKSNIHIKFQILLRFNI